VRAYIIMHGSDGSAIEHNRACIGRHEKSGRTYWLNVSNLRERGQDTQFRGGTCTYWEKLLPSAGEMSRPSLICHTCTFLIRENPGQATRH